MNQDPVFSSPEYEIIGKLGQGSMGVVYKARSRHVDFPGELVAIKVISPEMACDKNFQQRFLREMQVVTSLNHPNIVNARDYGVEVDNDIYFVVLEFLVGESLLQRMERELTLPLKEALEIVREVALGLQHAHENGIVHRDIKPDNILLGDDGNAKITDFGIVKPLNKSSDLTGTGIILGTPLYISPDQVSIENLDIRSDIYSLGITLFHILSGRPPFHYPNSILTIAAHCSDPLPEIHNFCPYLPQAVAELLDKMTKKDREERYTLPIDLVAAIDKILESTSEEVLKRRPSQSELKMGESSLSHQQGEVSLTRVGTNPGTSMVVEDGDSKLRILVVDGDEATGEALEAFLAEHQSQTEVVAVTSGKEALEVAIHHRPALIIMDVSLAEMSGIEICMILQKITNTASIPTILVAQVIDDSVQEQAFQCGAQDLLQKPINFRELKFKLRRFLG